MCYGNFSLFGNYRIICALGNGFVIKLIVLALRPNLGPQSCSLIPCTEK